mgnify:CR=1 FL=1
MEPEDDELLLDWSGEVRSTYEGDPVTNGLGVIPVLPSRFGVNVTAVYDSGDSSYAYPLNLGHNYVCENGNENYDHNYSPNIRWWQDGHLYIYFGNHTSNDLYFIFY